MQPRADSLTNVSDQNLLGLGDLGFGRARKNDAYRASTSSCLAAVHPSSRRLGERSVLHRIASFCAGMILHVPSHLDDRI